MSNTIYNCNLKRTLLKVKITHQLELHALFILFVILIVEYKIYTASPGQKCTSMYNVDRCVGGERGSHECSLLLQGSKIFIGLPDGLVRASGTGELDHPLYFVIIHSLIFILKPDFTITHPRGKGGNLALYTFVNLLVFKLL